MHCVLAFLSLCVGMVYSFSWEIVTSASHSNRLDFYDHDGTLTNSEYITPPLLGGIDIIYDPVHDRVLYADSHNIYSFEIATKKNECLISGTDSNVTSLAYDPVTELLFWTELYNHMYSISLKPTTDNNKNNEKQLISWDQLFIFQATVDICEGFIYYAQELSSNTSVFRFERARFDGSERTLEAVTDLGVYILIDPYQQTHKSYWSDPKFQRKTGYFTYTFKYADLNGHNIRTIRQSTPNMFFSLTASKEFIYMALTDNDRKGSIWKIPKNPPSDIDVESKIFVQYDKEVLGLASRYSIEDIIREHQNCDRLKSLLPNDTVSSDESLLRVHEKVSEESRCECTQDNSGERDDFEIPVCYNYCLHGDCSVTNDGQPECRCNAGYAGERCEVDACQGYCLNDGVCSLSEDSKPVCQCAGGNGGNRCEVSAFFMKTVSMWRDFLKTDVTSTSTSTPSTVSERLLYGTSTRTEAVEAFTLRSTITISAAD